MKLLAALFLFAALPAIAQTTPPAAPPSLKAQLAKTPLASVMIPEVVIDQASLADAIAMFTTLVETNTKGSIKLQWFDRALAGRDDMYRQAVHEAMEAMARRIAERAG